MRPILAIQPLGFPWKTQDPFLFCAYHRDEYPQGNASMGPDSRALTGRLIGQDFTLKDGWRMYHGSSVPGFPYHPHRGFETITINKEGVVDHSDSLGAAGRFMAGDVQWMTAGRGIQHSEMFPLVNSSAGNPLEIFQIWLNLPRASKMVDPHFKMLWREDVPVFEHKDEQNLTTTVDVIAGRINGVDALAPTPNSWAADARNAVGVFTVKMEANASWTLPATDVEAHRTIYFYKGDSVRLVDTAIHEHAMIEVDPSEVLRIQSGNEDCYLLILEGKPIGEPVVQHGPFVMNTESEIRETMLEYQRTQFGGWPWQAQEVVHPQEKGRFALHADGREELK